MMYFNSPVGKAGERGTAMALQLRMDSSITRLSVSIALADSERNSTYVVIAILGEKGYPLSGHFVARCLGQSLLLLEHIGD